MEEIWKDIDGFDGAYQISNLGRLKSLKNGELILKQCLLKNGYYMANLSLNGKRKAVNIHRLVAEYFIEKGDSFFRLVVDHIDGNKKNNIYTNLQWLTDRQNVTKGNAVNKNKLLGVNYHKDKNHFSCFLRIKKDRIHLAYHKSDVDYLSAFYNKAVELAHLYCGDKESFRQLIKSYITKNHYL